MDQLEKLNPLLVRKISNVVMHLIHHIRLKSGPLGTTSPLEFQPASVNVFVGPNNSGKSLFLREIAQFVRNGQFSQTFLVLGACQIGRLDDPAKALIRQKLIQQPSRGQILPPDHLLIGRRHDRNPHTKQQFEAWLDDLDQHVRQAGPHIVRHLLLSLDGSNRLALLQDQDRGDLLQPPQNLLSSLFRDDATRKEVRRIIHDAFGRFFYHRPNSCNSISSSAVR
jgi:hypothetical protein